MILALAKHKLGKQDGRDEDRERRGESAVYHKKGGAMEAEEAKSSKPRTREINNKDI